MGRFIEIWALLQTAVSRRPHWRRKAASRVLQWPPSAPQAASQLLKRAGHSAFDLIGVELTDADVIAAKAAINICRCASQFNNYSFRFL